MSGVVPELSEMPAGESPAASGTSPLTCGAIGVLAFETEMPASVIGVPSSGWPEMPVACRLEFDGL